MSYNFTADSCSCMQLLHQLAIAMLHAMRHCASCALLFTKLVLLHSKKQQGHFLILQGVTLSSLDCCSSQQDLTDLWSSPPKTHPHKSHFPPPISSLPQACAFPLACIMQEQHTCHLHHCPGHHSGWLHNLGVLCTIFAADRHAEALCASLCDASWYNLACRELQLHSRCPVWSC